MKTSKSLSRTKKKKPVAARNSGNVGALGMVRVECANFRKDACLGIDARCRFAMPLPGCLLHMGLPCAYFEQCMLPLSARHMEYAAAPQDYQRGLVLDVKRTVEGIQDQELQKLLRRHPFLAEAADEGQLSKAKVRRCECGAALMKRQRVCEKCAKKRRQKAYREQKQHQRELAGLVASA